jgi:hypothetical protein
LFLIGEALAPVMGGDAIVKWLTTAVGTAFILLVVISFLDALFTSPVALNSGEKFYPIQQNIIETLATILPWLGPGVIGVAVLLIGLIKMMGQSGGF